MVISEEDLLHKSSVWKRILQMIYIHFRLPLYYNLIFYSWKQSSLLKDIKLKVFTFWMMQYF